MNRVIPQSAAALISAATPIALNPNRRIAIHQVRDLCGGVSTMTIHRWQRNEAMGFPKPIYIGTRRYWSEGAIIAWLDAQAGRM